MLNYVWLGLIFLGLAAALSSDVLDKTTNRYQKGNEIRVSVLFSEPPDLKTEKTYEVVVKVNKEKFLKFYSESVNEDVEFKSKITLKRDDNTSPVYFVIDKEAPKIWQKMAKVNGKEDDLTGELKIIKLNEDNTAEAGLLLEEISFVKLKEVTNSALEYAEIAVKIALGLIGIMALWLGVMKIAEEAGLIQIIARALKPITKFLFPDVPSDHPAMGSMIMNISANFLGLGNAATPFGLKAMEELDKLNPEKGTATNAMCTFLAINTAGMTLIPATAIAVRAAAGSSEPAVIIGTALVGSTCATITGITAAKIMEKFPLKFGEFSAWLKSNVKFFFWVFGIVSLLAIFAFTGILTLLKGALSFINVETLKTFIQIVSTVAIPFLIMIFVGYGALKKVKVYETFVEGAKEGFNVAVRIIPYLVAMLMAIGIFRSGGAMEWLIFVLRPITDFIGMPAEALPMALMRPLSGSGSLGIMAEIISVHGPDSFIGILVSTFFGSTETTFYVLAVYFGSVSVKKTRHALPAGLLADIAGVLGAVFIVRLLFL